MLTLSFSWHYGMAKAPRGAVPLGQGGFEPHFAHPYPYAPALDRPLFRSFPAVS